MRKEEKEKIFNLLKGNTSLYLQNKNVFDIVPILKRTRKKIAIFSVQDIVKRQEFYTANILCYFPNDLKLLDGLLIYGISEISSRGNIVNDIIGQYFPKKQFILMSSVFDIKKVIGGFQK